MTYLRAFGTVVGASVGLFVAVGATVGACGGGGETTASAGSSGMEASASGTGGNAASSTAAGMGGGTTSGTSGTGGAATGTSSSTGGMPLPGYDCSAAVGSVPPLKLTQVASGLARPVLLKGEPGDNSRVYVLGQKGQIWIIKDGALLPKPFLDISADVHQPTSADERGLLGFAFHPKYAQNGRFFVYYTNSTKMGTIPEAQNLVEYKRSANDPNMADQIEVQKLFVEPDSEANHNGGMIEFSPKDGFLYVGMGDGGGSNDQHGTFGNGQNLSTRWGKILRLDVDSATKPYGIPAGNITMVPQLDVNDSKLKNPSDPSTLNGEIWDFGLRNPWRFSFDACTQDLYIGDVGQGLHEEIDIEPASQGKKNYGWRLTEGNADFNPGNYSKADIVGPHFTYDHSGKGNPPGTQGRCSIAGGYAYRGSAIPGLRGHYLFGDYCSSEIWTLTTSSPYVSNYNKDKASDLMIADGLVLTSFGQDNLGEVYVTAIDGKVYRIDAQ